MTLGKGLTNVLVIDDSDAARAAIASLLRAGGFGVFELSSAIGATRTILRNDVKAAIVDLSMPGLSGDKLVGLLRSNSKLENLTIIVVSGQRGDDLANIGRDCDVDGVLSKRDINVRLIPLLDSLLRGQRSATFRRGRLVANQGNQE